VDFVSIVSTTSPDDALALLLAMYAIFELNFHKNSRTVRLLYGIAFSDKRFLSNTIRNFIQEKGIDIYMEQNRKTSNDTNGISNNSATVNLNSQTSSQDKLNSHCPSSIEDVNSLNDENSASNLTIISNE
jgi:activator of HSP90 ATPase